MPSFADIDNVSQVPECVSFGELGSGTISQESGSMMAMSDFAGGVGPEPGEPFLPSGMHLGMPDFADVDSVSRVPDCVNFGEPRSGTVSLGSGGVVAMSNFAGDIDPGPGESLLPSGVHLDMPDFAVIDNVSHVLECISSGELGSGTISPESRNVMAMSDFVGDIDPEPGEPFMPLGVRLGLPYLSDVNSVSRVPD